VEGGTSLTVLTKKRTLKFSVMVKLFSHDGVRWFSDPVEAAQNQKRRQRFLQEQAQLIKKSAHFKYGESRCIKGD
jgi:hypothetical protein